jgi:transposase
LRSLTKSGRNKARVITRGRILLMTNEGLKDSDIASALKISIPTVERTRQKYVLGGLDMVIQEKPYPPRPSKVAGNKPKKIKQKNSELGKESNS